MPLLGGAGSKKHPQFARIRAYLVTPPRRHFSKSWGYK
jgi:hypothetical protein